MRGSPVSLLVAAMLVVGMPAVGLAQETDVQKRFNEAVELATNGYFDDAVRACLEVLDRLPEADRPRANKLLGYAYKKLEMFPESWHHLAAYREGAGKDDEAADKWQEEVEASLIDRYVKVAVSCDLPDVTLEVPSSVDESVELPRRCPVTLWLLPGEHRVKATAPGKSSKTFVIRVREHGDLGTRKLRLGPKPFPPPEKTPPPKEPLPKATPPKEPLPKGTPPKEPLPGETPPKEPLPRETPPKEPLPKETPPKEPLPRETPPKEPLPKEPLPGETAQPGETPPDATHSPVKTTSHRETPEETPLPEETPSSEVTPEEVPVPEKTPEKLARDMEYMHYHRTEWAAIALLVTTDSLGFVGSLLNFRWRHAYLELLRAHLGGTWSKEEKKANGVCGSLGAGVGIPVHFGKAGRFELRFGLDLKAVAFHLTGDIEEKDWVEDAEGLVGPGLALRATFVVHPPNASRAPSVQAGLEVLGVLRAYPGPDTLDWKIAPGLTLGAIF